MHTKLLFLWEIVHSAQVLFITGAITLITRLKRMLGGLLRTVRNETAWKLTKWKFIKILYARVEKTKQKNY